MLQSCTLLLSIVAPLRAAESDRDKRRTPVVEAYERARDAVVNISATEKVEIQGMGGLWGDYFRFPTERKSVGSGFIIHQDGYIVTNAHVVSAAMELRVTLANGDEYPARVIGRDTQLDLSVIKIDPREPLKPIPMGKSDDLLIGEQTIAIGNPVGLQNTLTTGVISALHRELEIGGRMIYRDIIQTDASINPGNSGGPLLNILGELIGVNTAIRTDAQNIGFAIPVDQLRQILPDVLDSEKLNKVQVGMTVAEAQPATVAIVREGSPADEAGVKPGDIVLALNGQPVTRGVDFHVALLDRQAGDVVRLHLQRGGTHRDVKVTLTPVPKPDGRKIAKERFGITVAAVTESAGRKFQSKRDGGVIVVAVEPRGPGDEVGLEPGDLIDSIERHWISDVDQLGAFLAPISTGDAVDIGIRRERRGMIYRGEVRIRAR